ncbi:histidine kinase [Burkholderia sp. Leaf177]|uniref:response regulator n=1 Tax=Burkholderia sp. Leaf177 TaxID=1736287 RepID=UPI0006F4F36C|nr:response regulator [Burkholderia sp. Leaf177]KQR81851.1 histidine kinase [Burkholderia sp. Leaf177]
MGLEGLAGLDRNVRVREWTDRRIDVQGEKMRVLVVDDHMLAAEALAMVLTLEDMVCRTAFGGLDAIAIGVAWIPHAIIMDISMPGCSGFDAALALRHDRRTNHVSIFAFTALDESEVLRHVVDDEFDGYCQKGQSPASLVALLTR